MASRRQPRWRWLARRWPKPIGGPERLRRILEDMGGTFVKFGQLLSLQPDILPSLDYCNALFNLLDRVAPFDMVDVERTFLEELGRRPAELFDTFDPKPLATASIGQVHVATLRGRRVAVKVRRPSVEAEFGGDIRLMTAALGLIRRLRRLHWLIEPLSEFISWTREELDLRCEAGYMDRLRRNARDNPVERVPEVVWEYTTRRTLVMEFFDGTTVLNYLRAAAAGDERALGRLAEGGFEPAAFARNLIDNFLGDAFKNGAFHADLHPANLMVLPGNVVGYIDFGITGVLSPYSRRHLIAMTLAYTRGDTEGMCRSFFNVSAVGPDSDVEGFKAGLRRLADEWYEVRGRQRRLRKNFTLVMLDMLRLSRSSGVWPERDVIKYIRSAIASDGLITRLAPQFDIGEYLERVCHRHLHWQSWGAVFSSEALLGWLTAGPPLVQDGALRGAAALRRLASGELPARADVVPARPDDHGTTRLRALQLGGVALWAAAMIVLTDQKPALGMNLFMGQLAVLAVALLLLARALWRLA